MTGRWEPWKGMLSAFGGGLFFATVFVGAVLALRTWAPAPVPQEVTVHLEGPIALYQLPPGTVITTPPIAPAK